MDDSTFKQFQMYLAQLTRLSAAQVKVALAEADDSVNDLTSSFTDIVKRDRDLRDLISSLPEDPHTAAIKAAITVQATAISSNVRNAIIAFQFFDRMTQRLDHSIHTMTSLSQIEQLDFGAHLNELSNLQEKIYQSYTMEEERRLHESILQEGSIDESVTAYFAGKGGEEEEEEDDIEFF